MVVQFLFLEGWSYFTWKWGDCECREMALRFPLGALIPFHCLDISKQELTKSLAGSPWLCLMCVFLCSAEEISHCDE